MCAIKEKKLNRLHTNLVFLLLAAESNPGMAAILEVKGHLRHALFVRVFQGQTELSTGVLDPAAGEQLPAPELAQLPRVARHSVRLVRRGHGQPGAGMFATLELELGTDGAHPVQEGVPVGTTSQRRLVTDEYDTGLGP